MSRPPRWWPWAVAVVVALMGVVALLLVHAVVRLGVSVDLLGDLTAVGSLP